jgi:hypothetical protein
MKLEGLGYSCEMDMYSEYKMKSHTRNGYEPQFWIYFLNKFQ